MHVLITGGAGFIGSHIAHTHHARGDRVTVLDNLLTGSENNIKDLMGQSGFRFIADDVCTARFDDLHTIDRVYHLASAASPIQYKKYPLETLKTNAQGTWRIVDWAHKKRARVILASTSEVYGDPLEHPQKETYFGNVNSFGPRACYDEAKRFAEAVAYTYITNYNADIRIVRIFNTYGPHMEKNDGRAVSNFVTAAIQNKPLTIYGSGEQTRSFCYVDDLVRGLIRIGDVENPHYRVMNLGNPQELSIQTLAEKVLKLSKSTSPISYHPPSDENDPSRRQPDISRAKKELQWEPVISLDEGLKKTISYFRSIL